MNSVQWPVRLVCINLHKFENRQQDSWRKIKMHLASAKNSICQSKKHDSAEILYGEIAGTNQLFLTTERRAGETVNSLSEHVDLLSCLKPVERQITFFLLVKHYVHRVKLFSLTPFSRECLHLLRICIVSTAILSSVIINDELCIYMCVWKQTVVNSYIIIDRLYIDIAK